jgi:hypothetical protein
LGTSRRTSRAPLASAGCTSFARTPFEQNLRKFMHELDAFEMRQVAERFQTDGTPRGGRSCVPIAITSRRLPFVGRTRCHSSRDLGHVVIAWRTTVINRSREKPALACTAMPWATART